MESETESEIKEDDIPIQNPEEDDPFIDEVSEEDILEDVEISSELSEDIGGLNELPDTGEEFTLSFDLGDTYIVLLDKRDKPFLAKIIEIVSDENKLVMEDDTKKILSFQFENSEIIMKTDGYEILDMIRIKPEPYEPEKEDTEYAELEFDVEELLEKQYSDLAKSDDLLSSLIRSMNIYDNPLMIQKMQETIDIFLELIHEQQEEDDVRLLFPKWLIPVIEDDLKLYDFSDDILTAELIEESKASEDVRNYRDYLNNSLKYSKPIETKTGYGLETDEYSGIYLRNCLQDDSCNGIMGAYTYDERRNTKTLRYGDEIILPADRLRIVGLLEEPLNMTIYSVNLDTLSKFTLFEKYIYDHLNKQTNFSKKKRIGKSLIVSSEDDSEDREKDKFILHNLPNNSQLDIVDTYRSNCMIELIDLLLNDDTIKYSLYNYSDIEKIFFKYDLSYDKLSSSNRDKVNSMISENIKEYKNEYYSKGPPIEDIKVTKTALTDEKRVSLSYNLIFSLKKRSERNYYLQQFIDLFTRSSDKDIESQNYLYNKYTDEELLCKHYLYEVNITNDNDIFFTMKSKFGLPAEDGYISCKICGGYLCPEDSSLFDGYEDDKPMVIREVLSQDEEKKIEITEYIKEKTEPVKLIKDVSSSLGVVCHEKDIYEILLSFELLDHNILADVRYDMRDVSISDSHPRINKEIQKIKALEKEEKDKKKKKEFKLKRENIIKQFQLWLKDTNKILMFTVLTSLYIQTAIPSYYKDKTKIFELLNLKDKTINKSSLKYLSAKIRRLCEKYEKEKLWKNGLGLFNEKEYELNEIDTQLGLTTKYCIAPNFPKIINRITRLEEYMESVKHNYLKEEWVTFKPLQDNILVKNISEYLKKINDDNSNHFRKVYGGYTIENCSLVRTKTQSYNNPISEVLEIPEIEIFKNNSFKKLFRYTVTLYGKHPSNIFITLTCQRLLETCDKKDEVLKIFIKNGWNELSGSFRKLDFGKLRKNIIPEILSVYGDKNTDINSCYSNEKSCNDFIHNAINTYDLPLLNTKPKRIYSYKISEIYPVLPYGRLNEIIRYDEEGKEQKNLVEKIFEIYKYDEMGNIVKKYSDDFYLQFYAKVSLMKIDVLTMIKFKNIEKSEEHFLRILETIQKENSLLYKGIIIKKHKYFDDDYRQIGINARLDNRFYEYLKIIDKDKMTEEKRIIHENLLKIFGEINNYDIAPAINEKIDLELKGYFSSIISETEQNINMISRFLSQSDEITNNQKNRFESIFKEYNPGQRISFKSDNIESIINLFIMDQNLNYSYLVRYLNDIRNILSRLINMNKSVTNLPREWKCSDGIYSEYKDFIDRDGNSVYLYLHNNIFMKTKDNYTGFNQYINDDNENCNFFKLLFDNIGNSFNNLDMIKGSSHSKYNDIYSNIYMKYHFIGLFSDIINYINDLKDSQSEVTSDANDLFQSLEKRDEDLIDDMIETLSKFLIDLLTHILFQHYDPSWLFLNEQKLDLANRLSKQKEREKQVIIEKLDNLSAEERFTMMQKQSMGISNWWKQSAEQSSEYIRSEEHATHNEDERQERIKEIMSQSNVELDFLRSQEDVEVSDIPSAALIDPILEEEGYVDYEEIDEEDEDYRDDYLDDELEPEFNE